MLSTTAPIKERTLEFMRSKGLTVYEFAKKIEVSPGVFYGRGLQSELSGDIIGKILTAYPEVNPYWLITGKGPMIMNESTRNLTEIQELLNDLVKKIAIYQEINDLILTKANEVKEKLSNYGRTKSKNDNHSSTE